MISIDESALLKEYKSWFKQEKWNIQKSISQQPTDVTQKIKHVQIPLIKNYIAMLFSNFCEAQPTS